jgi:hypothetical protein
MQKHSPYHIVLFHARDYTISSRPHNARRCAKGDREVVQLNESNRKGKLSRWRKALLKKNDRERKRKEKCRKERPHGGVARKNNKGIAICSMMRAAKPNHSPTERDAVRNYITQHVPGTHLTFEQRQTAVYYKNIAIYIGR